MGILYCLYVIVASAFGVAAFRLHGALRRFRRHDLMSGKNMIDHLPSVSVCIPARNEGHVMTESLQRVIASTYPKMEIIVMDDLSGDKTPSLIKAFAQDGVRFIEGAPLAQGWLGKNHALDTLLKQASGTYVLFLDVDTHVSPHTIEQLVAYAEREKAAMVSVLPRREDGIRASTIGAPLRYFWELMFHRTETPAVASSAWLLNRRRFIEDFGDFEKLKRVIQPEAHLAATYAAQHAYRFLIGTPLLGLSHEKKWRSQTDTSIRLLFPLLGGNVLHTIVVALDLLILVTPFILLLVLGLPAWSVHAIPGVLLYVAGCVLYGTYLKAIWRKGWLVGALVWPYIVLQEASLVIMSAVQYKRRRVVWKGRRVQLP